MATVFVTVVDVNEKEVTVVDASEWLNNIFPRKLFHHDKKAGTSTEVETCFGSLNEVVTS